MFIMGWLGMPRRYYDYMPEFNIWHQISTVGSWLLATGVFIFFIYFIKSLRAPAGAPDNPWGGTTLEWSTPSPPPMENFVEIPTVTTGPYDHHGEGDA
jgi:cytochrome c oxidase subunit 1